MPTVTEEERKSGSFEGYKATPEDYAMYATYSTVRLRLLAWFGDPVAKRILGSR